MANPLILTPVLEASSQCENQVVENRPLDEEDAGYDDCPSNEGMTTKPTSFICQENVYNDEAEPHTEGQSQLAGLELGEVCRVYGYEKSKDLVDGPDTRYNPGLAVRIKTVSVGSFAQVLGLRKNDRMIEINGQLCKTRKEAREAFCSLTDENLELVIFQRWETNPDTRKQYQIRREKGTIVTEAIDITTITKCRSTSPINLEKLSLDRELGPEEVYLKSSGPDRSLYVVAENNVLGLKRDIAPEEFEGLALFKLYRYFDMPWIFASEYQPVVIQHKSSGLCVSLQNNAVVLKKIPDIEDVSYNSPFLFRRKAFGENGNKIAFFCTINGTENFINFNRDKVDGSRATVNRSLHDSLLTLIANP